MRLAPPPHLPQAHPKKLAVQTCDESYMGGVQALIPALELCRMHGCLSFI